MQDEGQEHAQTAAPEGISREDALYQEAIALVQKEGADIHMVGASAGADHVASVNPHRAGHRLAAAQRRRFLAHAPPLAAQAIGTPAAWRAASKRATRSTGRNGVSAGTDSSVAAPIVCAQRIPASTPASGPG